MAFSRPTGKHRGPKRLTRRTAGVAGVATLATAGVVGTLASPAMADSATVSTAQEVRLDRTILVGDTVADEIAAQATAQQHEAVAKARAEAAAAKAKAEREAKKAAEQRAARAAARKRLNAYVAPVANSYVSTGYKTGGSLWSSGSHTGIDFHAASGTPVHAVGAGTVVEAGWGGAYGNNIVIRMHDGTYTQYGHLSSIGVSVGQSVTSDQQIALSGATGNATGPHLHFEARTGPDYGSDIDPVAYLRSHGVKV
ncbi:M23 family metallopeptidase [Streptomyces sp. NPDC090052]|uniref:M23 family metallopeptidase n=1 Tax=unclassified Streptomyces TaxID=2593676 RepID=UPI002254F86A|nr:M23 family metallopeptidase [Streptomyces sp. NBC_01306]MCX4723280.1 M23 family metallopeptidase [Streptomyces sp. NBC_01306]WSX45217.1 M23 family metallopeptidase [Streptomyces sp. NBC_00963]